MHPRGKSVEPGELNATRPNYVSRRQMRARSAGPISTRDRTSRLLQNQYDQAGAEQQMASSLPRQPDRALINQHVNPYQEFPSLRRGFTLEGKAFEFSLFLHSIIQLIFPKLTCRLQGIKKNLIIRNSDDRDEKTFDIVSKRSRLLIKKM